MRKELIEIEQIEKYLQHQMSESEQIKFETEINNNPKLKTKVNAQQLIMDAVQRLALKKSTQTAHHNYKTKALLTKLIALIAIIAVAGFVTLKLIDTKNTQKTTNNTKKVSFLPKNNIKSNQKVIDSTKIVNILPKNDSITNFSNQFLEQEVFSIHTKSDTILENKDGVVIYIPANAFDTETEIIDLVVQSAINAEDILYAGLSTTTDGQALETGGMFYIDAFNNGKRIKLIKDLQVDVPTSNKINDMQVYKGEKTKDGDINWVNPNPLKNKLTPVDILSLDFFPPTYNTKLTEWGHPKKEFKDSLYYSFAFEENVAELDLVSKVKNDYTYGEGQAKKFTTSDFELNNTWVDGKSKNPSSVDEVIKWEIKAKHIGNNDYEITLSANLNDGWEIDEKTKREIKFKGDGFILKGKIINNSLYTSSLDNPEEREWRYAEYVQKIHITKTTFLKIEYSFMVCKVACFPPEFRSHLLKLKYRELGDSLEQITSSKINPATIKTIWQPTFNNTNLATTQFEERLFWIHKACNQKVLELYVNNLGKPLSEIDAMAIKILSGEVKAKFIEFAKRNDGKVDINDEASKKLSQFYKTKSKAYAKALIETQKAYWKTQATKDAKQNQANQQSINREYLSKNDVFEKELQKNLCKVYSELKQNYDCSKKPRQPSKHRYSATISSTGWHNIDRQVIKATFNRTTTTISYKDKTSTLTYHQWTGTVDNYQNYNRIYVYNVPKTINSYVKIKGTKGIYNYTLNADLKYETVILAWSDNQLFYATKSTKKGSQNFKLTAVSEQEFKTTIKAKLNYINSMTDEIDYIVNTQKDEKRVKVNLKRKALRKKVEPIVFPCGCEVDTLNAVIEDIEIISGNGIF